MRHITHAAIRHYHNQTKHHSNTELDTVYHKTIEADALAQLGEQELADGCIGIKPLRSTGEQISVALDELAETLARQLR